MSDPRQAPPGWYPHMGGHRYWNGFAWTAQFRPGPTSPAGSGGDGNSHLWWALSPAYTFGVVAFIPALHAAIKLQRRDLWIWAVGLILGNMALWGLMGSDLPSGIIVPIMMTLGTIHAFKVRDEVFGSSGASVLGPGPTAAKDDPAVAHSLAARKRRVESMALAASDPGVARDLRMGRPDLGQRHYDDGGLVDINHVPEAVLVSHLGLTAEQAQSVVEARGKIDGFERADDLCHMVGLPPRIVDAVRDRIVAL